MIAEIEMELYFGIFCEVYAKMSEMIASRAPAVDKVLRTMNSSGVVLDRS